MPRRTKVRLRACVRRTGRLKPGSDGAHMRGSPLRLWGGDMSRLKVCRHRPVRPPPLVARLTIAAQHEHLSFAYHSVILPPALDDALHLAFSLRTKLSHFDLADLALNCFLELVQARVGESAFRGSWPARVPRPTGDTLGLPDEVLKDRLLRYWRDGACHFFSRCGFSALILPAQWSPITSTTSHPPALLLSLRSSSASSCRSSRSPSLPRPPCPSRRFCAQQPMRLLPKGRACASRLRRSRSSPSPRSSRAPRPRSGRSCTC